MTLEPSNGPEYDSRIMTVHYKITVGSPYLAFTVRGFDLCSKFFDSRCAQASCPVWLAPARNMTGLSWIRRGIHRGSQSPAPAIQPGQRSGQGTGGLRRGGTQTHNHNSEI